MPDYEEHPGILERLESDVDLSPALVPYTRDTVDLTSALTDQRKPWAGDYLYVESLKGQLQLKFNSRDAFALTVREGEVYRLPFQQVYVSTAGNSAWGTASIVVGKGEFALDPSAHRVPVVVYTATGTGALSLSTSEGRRFKLLRATVHFSSAPTSSEDLTLTENANAGAAYDTVLERTDPSVNGVTDVVITPDGEWVFEEGTELDLAYTNTDGRTIGAQIVVTPA